MRLFPVDKFLLFPQLRELNIQFSQEFLSPYSFQQYVPRQQISPVTAKPLILQGFFSFCTFAGVC
jgi:hypothetical protein